MHKVNLESALVKLIVEQLLCSFLKGEDIYAIQPCITTRISTPANIIPAYKESISIPASLYKLPYKNLK